MPLRLLRASCRVITSPETGEAEQSAWSGRRWRGLFAYCKSSARRHSGWTFGLKERCDTLRN